MLKNIKQTSVWMLPQNISIYNPCVGKIWNWEYLLLFSLFFFVILHCGQPNCHKNSRDESYSSSVKDRIHPRKSWLECYWTLNTSYAVNFGLCLHLFWAKKKAISKACQENPVNIKKKPTSLCGSINRFIANIVQTAMFYHVSHRSNALKIHFRN